MRRWHLGVVGLVVAPWFAGCADSGPSLPAGVPAAERLPGIRFGLSPLELEELRRQVALDDEGVYREELNLRTTASYGFLPWNEGRPPGRDARLAGVEVREQARNPRTLAELWDEAIGRASDPTCTAETSFRLVRWTAATTERAPDSAEDSIRVTWVAEIVTAGDGQAHEAYLSTRMEIPGFAEQTPAGGGYGRGRHPTRAEAVECGDVSAETRRGLLTGVTPR